MFSNMLKNGRRVSTFFPCGNRYHSTFNTRETLSDFVSSWKSRNNPKPLKNTLVLGIQHLLETTGDMFQVLKEDLGLENAILAGKSYSTHQGTLERIQNMGFTVLDGEQEYPLCLQDFEIEMDNKALRIWQEAFLRIESRKFDQFIIIDDGTHVIRATPGKLFNGLRNKPDSVIGIEQTKGGAQGGANNYAKFYGYPFPILHVGGSYVKNFVEYSHVANIALEKILEHAKEHMEATQGISIGIFGYGSLGKELIDILVGKEEISAIYLYDKNASKVEKLKNSEHSSKLKIAEEPSVPIWNSDIIIGATGQDMTALSGVLAACKATKMSKIFYSVGSGAYEFETLLAEAQIQQKKQYYSTPKPLSNVIYENQEGAKIIIARSGCPMNFQNTAHSVPAEYIWPTRAALLSAVLSAQQLASEKQAKSYNYPGIYSLPWDMQHDILRRYASQTNKEEVTNLLSMPKENIEKTIVEGSVGVCSGFRELSALHYKEGIKKAQNPDYNQLKTFNKCMSSSM